MKVTERKPYKGRGVSAVIVEADEEKRLYILGDYCTPKRIQIIETTDPPPDWLKRIIKEPQP